MRWGSAAELSMRQNDPQEAILSVDDRFAHIRGARSAGQVFQLAGAGSMLGDAQAG
jgi:hypothetical protein